MKKLVIKAVWDDEAAVWVASSDDVPGLATEASTSDELVAKLKVMIPELLQANTTDQVPDDIPFELLSQLNAVAHREAC